MRAGTETTAGCARPAWRGRGALATLAMALVVLAACGGPAEEAQDESLRHLQAAVAILEAQAGKPDAAAQALDAYLDAHRDAILQAKARGITALEAMTPAKREAFRARSLERIRPIRERLDTLARTFPEPQPILQRLRHFQ